MEDKNSIHELRKVFIKDSKKVAVFLRSTQSKGVNYDPYRNTGVTINVRNPIWIKALIRQVSPEKLIVKEMGLTISDAVELLIKSSDVGAIKAADKLQIDGIDYVTFHEALGSKILIFQRPLDLTRIIVFRKEK